MANLEKMARGAAGRGAVVQGDIETAAGALNSAGRVLVMTGAGISAESGVPTFRGEEGMYKGRDPMQLASPQGFRSDPRLVWEWYCWRRSIVAAAEPNAGHLTLAEWEASGRFDDFLLLTQNVDGLHRRAGSQNVFEHHGNIWRVKGWESGRIYDGMEIDPENLPPYAPPEKGKRGEMLRPDVVWFGEALPLEPFEAFQQFLEQANTSDGAQDVCLVIGTAGLISYIPQLVMAARSAGLYLIEINPEATQLSPYMDTRIPGPSGEVLPELTGLL